MKRRAPPHPDVFIAERYQVRALAGRGASADVFRVRDRVLGRELALKRYRSRAGAALKRALADEFVLLAQMDHPVLPAVHDFGFDDEDRPFFTMAYLAGPSLARLRSSWDRIAPAEGAAVLARYGGRILSALSYIHSRGVVHGDIKPSNVLFLSAGRGMPPPRDLRLVDFGLSGALTQLEGWSRGTPRYMAPEVLRGGAPDTQSDLYGLGLILGEKLRAQRESTSGDDGFVDHLRSFIARLADPSRGLRFRSAEEAYGDLLGILERKDRAAVSELRKSFSFAIRPHSWEPVALAILRKLSDCRSGRGGIAVAEGLRDASARRLFGEIRARALVTRMAVERLPLQEGGSPERIRIALGEALDRLSLEGAASARATTRRREESLRAPSSALATRLAAVSASAGTGGALWILENHGPLSEEDCRSLSHLSLALKKAPVLVLIPCSGFADGARGRLDSSDIHCFPALDQKGIEQALVDVFREITPLAGLAAVLEELSGGDVEELGRILVHLVQTDALHRKQGSWIGDAVMIRRLIRKRLPARDELRSLPPALEIHARTLAVLGMRFDEKCAAAVTRMNPRVLLKVLAELRSAGYLHERSAGRNDVEWRFTIPGLAERLVSRLKQPVRIALHRRALRHLESRGERGVAPAERAWHHEGAGEKDMAARAYMELGAHLVRNGDLSGGSVHLDYALSILPAGASSLESEIRYRLSMARQEAGHAEQSLFHLDRLLGERGVLPAGVDRVDLRIAQARNLEMLGRHAEAMRLLEAAFAESSTADLRRRAVIQRARGWVAYLGGLTQQAAELQRGAMDIATAIADREVIASAHSLAGSILRSSGREPEAEAEFEKAIVLHKELGHAREAVIDLSNIGILALRRDPGKAHEIFTRVRNESARLGDDHLYAATLMNLAILEKTRGDWGAAEKCYRISIDVGEQIGVRGLHRAYMNLGNLLTDRGEFEEASACFDRASLLAAGHQGKIPVLFVELNRARLALRRGLPEQARELLESAAPGLTLDHPATWMNLHMYLAQALAELGRFDEAARAARTAAAAAADQNDETFKGEVLLYGGIVDRFSGNREGAREKLDRAEEIFKKHGQQHYAARARLERAELFALDQGTSGDGLEDARAAAETFERLGMSPFLARAQRVRDRLVEAVRRGADAPRELQTLYRLAEILSAPSDFPALLQDILDAAISLLGAERGAIFLRAEGGAGELELGASRHVSSAQTKDVRRTSHGIMKRALKDDSPLLSRDAMQDSRLRSLKSVIQFEIRSVVCAALRTSERVIGTIYLDHRQPGRFAEREAEFLRALAGFAAPAILAAHARQRLDEEVRGLRSAVQGLSREGVQAFPLSSLIGESDAMRKVRDLVERYARTRSNVLLLGETGTGKDLAARVIHHAGERAAKIFHTVGGTELQGDIGHSNLSGIARGIATGVEPRAGMFELANGGTLYMHEIEALPIEAQARLLRVIEEPYVERVGGTTRIPVNVRLITATSADLQTLVEQGTFRKDLYFRLNVVSIVIPPLRHRRQDVAPLLHHYLNLVSTDMEVPPLRIPSTVLKEYEAYPWPGNVRELRHFVERAVALGGDEFPHLADLASNEMRAQDSRWVEDVAISQETLDAFCARYVERVFDRCGGRKVLAYKVLGINYRTLQRYLAMRGRGGKNRPR